MICQLSSILGPLLQAGIGFGTQFLERELGRDSRRAQKDLLKAQARATGGGSNFTQAQSPGTVSPPFAANTQFVANPFGNMAGRNAMGIPSTQTFTPQPSTQFAGIGPGAVATAEGAAFGSRQSRFVLDKVSGCLRPAQPGEKGPKFRIDARGDFVKVKARKINPANKSAARRASRRIDSVLSFMSDLVKVETKRDKGKSAGGGKVVKFRTKSKRKCS